MSLSVDQAFIKQFESDVHLAYQRMGSKLQGTLRVKPNVNGSQARFQKVGKGAAVQKSRHGQVPVMNLDHTNVDATLSDYYSADYVDSLDELKVNIDERSVVAQSAAGALGRKADELITTALDGTSNTVTESGSDGLTQAKINTVFAYFGENDVPDDGDRVFVVSPEGWIDLLAISAFSDADFVGPDELPYKGGMVAKRWLGFLWITFSGLPESSSKRQCFAYHRTGAGLAIGADVRTEINYIPERVSNLITAYMSMGVVLIDDTAVYEVQIAE
jgi:competence protein ComGC